MENNEFSEVPVQIAGNDPLWSRQFNKVLEQLLTFNSLDTKIVEYVKLLEEDELAELDLSNSGITEDQIFLLADALKMNTSLRKMNLEENEISELGVSVLVNALKENTSLTDLRLGRDQTRSIYLDVLEHNGRLLEHAHITEKYLIACRLQNLEDYYEHYKSIYMFEWANSVTQEYKKYNNIVGYNAFLHTIKDQEILDRSIFTQIASFCSTDSNLPELAQILKLRNCDYTPTDSADYLLQFNPLHNPAYASERQPITETESMVDGYLQDALYIKRFINKTLLKRSEHYKLSPAEALVTSIALEDTLKLKILFSKHEELIKTPLTIKNGIELTPLEIAVYLGSTKSINYILEDKSVQETLASEYSTNILETAILHGTKETNDLLFQHMDLTDAAIKLLDLDAPNYKILYLLTKLVKLHPECAADSVAYHALLKGNEAAARALLNSENYIGALSIAISDGSYEVKDKIIEIKNELFPTNEEEEDLDYDYYHYHDTIEPYLDLDLDLDLDYQDFALGDYYYKVIDYQP